jgi:hypothetical protein
MRLIDQVKILDQFWCRGPLHWSTVLFSINDSHRIDGIRAELRNTFLRETHLPTSFATFPRIGICENVLVTSWHDRKVLYCFLVFDGDIFVTVHLFETTRPLDELPHSELAAGTRFHGLKAVIRSSTTVEELLGGFDLLLL